MMPNYPLNTYSQPYDVSLEGTTKNINILEVGVILISFASLILIFIFGFWTQSNKNRDAQRNYEITQVLLALDQYYRSSSINPSDRTYPIAVCSGQLNEVDYEFVLQDFLTGKRLEREPHAYIAPSQWPTDRWGVYSQKIGERKLNLRDCPKVFQTKFTSTEEFIFKDQRKSCNFRSSDSRYRRCYLYTSSTSGDKFELAYYSESDNRYIVYSRFRDNNIVVDSVSI